jgi:prevent-host-death family protein
MTTLTATEAKSRFGELVEKAQIEPIRVSRSGRDAVVIVSAAEFDRLSEIDDRNWGERAMEVVRTQTPLDPKESAAWLAGLVSDRE